MFIGACGFGSTGSSVITDYLREFDDICVKDDIEFTWVSKTDGLIDLERAVMQPHNRTSDSIVAIERFIEAAKNNEHAYEQHGLSANTFNSSVSKLIDSITTVKWYWYDTRINYRYRSRYFLHAFMKRKIIPKIEKKIGHHSTLWPLKEVRLSIKPENFYQAAREHVDEILSGMGLNTDLIIAMDQPFAGNNPQACFPYFKDPYAIVVDRDPRDNYVFAKTRMLGKFHYMPINNVEDFISYYRALRKGQPYRESNERVLKVRFEDMVYEYDATTRIVREFLHLPENPRPCSVFDPSLSIANTQVYKRFPQFSDDIVKIEGQLSEYLYDFSKYPAPDMSKKMFYGKSPLHKGFKKEYSE